MMSYLMPGVLSLSGSQIGLVPPLTSFVQRAWYSALKPSSAKPKAAAKVSSKSSKSAASTGSSEKPKKEKLPRALSAWAFYVKDNLSSARGDGNGGTVTGAMQLLGKRWKQLSDAEKAPYEQRALQSKEETGKARETIKAKKEANKGPLSGYTQFVKEATLELRSTNSSLSAPERMKEAAKMWKELPDAERERRQNDAKAAIAKWKAEQQGHQ